MEKYFVEKESIVRRIWGSSDTVLFIFAGAAAEFALNKAVDWLFFTGRLPADPLARLFSTVSYARKIIFSEEKDAIEAIQQINGIHKGVEQNRGAAIPDWAYLDVLFLLIDYSVRSFELLDRKLSVKEKSEIFDVFYRVGIIMNLKNLPPEYETYSSARDINLRTNLENGDLTKKLYQQYKLHLGSIRFAILVQVQLYLVPKAVKDQLFKGRKKRIALLIDGYKALRYFHISNPIKILLLPRRFKKQILAIDNSNRIK